MDRHSGRTRLLWLANVASPYRRPVWEALGRRYDLVVALLEDDARLRRDGRRGGDWAGAVASAYRLARLRTQRVVRGEEAYYALHPASGLPLPGAHAVVLGGWESPAFWQALVSAHLRGVAAVGFYESTEETNRFRSGPIAAARGWFFRHLDAVVVPGPAAAALVRTFGVAEERLHVGFNAVDVRGFADAAAAARAAGPRQEPGHRFVYVGQLIDRKNVDGLLRAFAAAAGPEDRLTVIGEGELGARLRHLAAALDLGGRVDFAGAVAYQDLGAALARHDTLVLPSHREVWGLVVNEALACGLGAVVADTAGVAPSVRGMPAVVEVSAGDEALAAGLRTARSSWTGPIEDPPILAATPEAFADVFADAVDAAVARRTR